MINDYNNGEKVSFKARILSINEKKSKYNENYLSFLFKNLENNSIQAKRNKQRERVFGKIWETSEKKIDLKVGEIVIIEGDFVKTKYKGKTLKYVNIKSIELTKDFKYNISEEELLYYKEIEKNKKEVCDMRIEQRNKEEKFKKSIDTYFLQNKFFELGI